MSGSTKPILEATQETRAESKTLRLLPPQKPGVIEKQEKIFSNFIPLLDYPQTIYVTPTKYTSHEHVWSDLRKAVGTVDLPSTWLLYEGNFVSFFDPSVTEFRRVCDTTATEGFASQDWAHSFDSTKTNVFIYLLKQALAQDIWREGVKFYRLFDLYAFYCPLKYAPKKYQRKSFSNDSCPTVVFVYPEKTKSGEVRNYMRQNAFHGRFRKFGNQWFLEVCPTYLYTTDGKQKYRYHNERLAKIKRIEKNKAVLQQLLLWSTVLQFAPNLLSSYRPILRFGTLIELTAPKSINEREWKRTGEQQEETDQTNLWGSHDED